MKKRRLTALFTAFALMCSVFVSASAANSTEVATSAQSLSVGGKQLDITTSSEEDGSIVINAVGNGESATATRIGNIIYVTETVGDVVTEYGVDLDNLPDVPSSSVSPYATYDTIESRFWGFTCLRSWREEAAHGLFWSMECDNGQYANYDEKDSMARGYGEAFWNNIVAMNSHFDTAMLLVDSAVIATMAAAAASAGTLTAAAAILSTIAAGAPAVANLLDAKSEALDANYNFDRFKAST